MRAKYPYKGKPMKNDTPSHLRAK